METDSSVRRLMRVYRTQVRTFLAAIMMGSSGSRFCSSSVRLNSCSIPVGQGAGKTTMLRALCAEIGPMEALGTFETEYELHLHVRKAWQALLTSRIQFDAV